MSSLRLELEEGEEFPKCMEESSSSPSLSSSFFPPEGPFFSFTPDFFAPPFAGVFKTFAEEEEEEEEDDEDSPLAAIAASLAGDHS